MPSGPQADSRFLIGRIAHVFVSSLTSDEPIREVWIRGHSDRVWTPRGHNTADEKSVSEDRARDVRSEFFNAVVTDPTGLFTPRALADAIRTGTLSVLTAGLGARFPLRSTNSGAVPENRRVEILLWVNQSVPI
jgi:outer membrane protein OmpA-like peptidoglycan-associated protein